MFTKRLLGKLIEFNVISLNHFSTKTKHFESIIAKETEIVRNQLVPEIKLHLITQNCKLYHAKADESELHEPFFAFFWAGGIAVTRYMLDNPNLVKNKTCLDFGCGSGASSIAAMMCGAKKAVANDIDEVSLIAAKMNAKLNNIELVTDSRNLINHPDSFNYDVIFLGDVFYDEEFAVQLIPWIRNLIKAEKKIIIGDPGRHAFNACKNLNLKLLQEYKLPENVCIENNGFQYGYVWELHKSID